MTKYNVTLTFVVTTEVEAEDKYSAIDAGWNLNAEVVDHPIMKAGGWLDAEVEQID